MTQDIIPLSDAAQTLLAALKADLGKTGKADGADDVLCDADPVARAEFYRNGWIIGYADVDASTLEPYVSYRLTPVGCRIIGVDPATGSEKLGEQWSRPYGDKVPVWRASEVAVARRKDGCVAINALGGLAYASRVRDAATAALYDLANRLEIPPPVEMPEDAELDGDNHPGLWCH